MNIEKWLHSILLIQIFKQYSKYGYFCVLVNSIAEFSLMIVFGLRRWAHWALKSLRTYFRSLAKFLFRQGISLGEVIGSTGQLVLYNFLMSLLLSVIISNELQVLDVCTHLIRPCYPYLAVEKSCCFSSIFLEQCDLGMIHSNNICYPGIPCYSLYFIIALPTA